MLRTEGRRQSMQQGNEGIKLWSGWGWVSGEAPSSGSMGTLYIRAAGVVCI